MCALSLLQRPHWDTEGMGYELRVIADCPNSAAALELFRRALAAEEIAGDLRVVELTTAEEAEKLDFHGSPSFIAHGLDLFSSAAGAALACRVYPSSSGLSGLPKLEDLQAALRAQHA